MDCCPICDGNVYGTKLPTGVYGMACRDCDWFRVERPELLKPSVRTTGPTWDEYRLNRKKETTKMTDMQAYNLICAALATLNVVNSASTWNLRDIIDSLDSAADEIAGATGQKIA